MARRPVASTPSFRALSAIVDGGRTTFRVWAPNRRQVNAEAGVIEPRARSCMGIRQLQRAQRRSRGGRPSPASIMLDGSR